MFSTGFNSGEREGNRISVMFLGDRELVGRVPAGAIEAAKRRGRPWRRLGWDFVEVKLHGLGVGVGHGERGASPARRADGRRTDRCSHNAGRQAGGALFRAWALGEPRPFLLPDSAPRPYMRVRLSMAFLHAVLRSRD